MKKNITLSMVASFLLASCNSTVTENKIEKDSQPYTKPHAGPIQISTVMKSKMYVAVQISTRGNAVAANKLGLELEGHLADTGFGINDDKQAFVKVVLGNVESRTLGRFGSSRKMRLATSVSVRRVDNKLLGRKNFSVVGERASTDEDAFVNAGQELSDTISNWVEGLCTSASNGMNACVLNVDMSDYKDYFWGNDSRAEDKALDVTRFTSMANALKGVFDCQLIETKGDIYSFRIIYMTESFPNGLTSRSVRSHDVKVDEDDPLKALMDVIFASSN